MTAAETPDDAGHGGTHIDHALNASAWALALVGPLVGPALEPGSKGAVDPTQLVIVQLLIWTLLLTRLAISVRRWPHRRPALIPLTVGVLLWAVASAALNSSGESAATQFPAPHELLFLTSYVGFVLFIVFDVGHRSRRSLTTWLDAVILCGGAGALTATVLLVPISGSHPDGGGLPLMVASIYAVLDLMLALLVLGQWALAARPTTWRTFMIAASFVTLAIADLSLVTNLATGTYSFTVLLDVLWGGSFILLVDAGCRLPSPPPLSPRRLPPALLAAASAGAIAALILRPVGALGLVLAFPALLALTAVVARLALVYRGSRIDARGRGEAGIDESTGLPNRRAMLAHLDSRQGESLSVILVGIDAVQDTQDAPGSDDEDPRWSSLVSRLRAVLAPGTLIASSGANEIAIIPETGGSVDPFLVARDVRSSIDAPVGVGGDPRLVEATVGLATSASSDSSTVDVLRRADIALSVARESGSGLHVFDVSDDDFGDERLIMAEQIRQGLATGQYVMHYEPQVHAETGFVTAMQALIRWEHPSDGVMVPMAFLSVARRANLMHVVTELSARRALADGRQWQLSGFTFGITLAVAPPEFLSRDFLRQLIEAREAIGLPPHRLALEVSDECWMLHPRRATQDLLAAHEQGVTIVCNISRPATTALTALRDLPLTDITLNRSIVADVSSDETAREKVRSMIDAAHARNVTVLADGIDDAGICGEMQAMGVDLLRGEYISSPLPVQDVTRWVRNRTAAIRLPQHPWGVAPQERGPSAGLTGDTRSDEREPAVSVAQAWREGG